MKAFIAGLFLLLYHGVFAAAMMSCDPITLTVTKTVSDEASLSWNAVVSNVSNGYYKIYREYPLGTWTLFDSVTTTNYLDKITICGDSIKYRIEIEDISGCVSVSNVDGNYFIDVTPPAQPVLDSVSVDASGNAIIGWNQNSSSDTKAYVIVQNINGSWIPVDTTFGIGSTFYPSTISAIFNPQQFRVFAIDNCGNPSFPSKEQESLLLTGSIVPCQASVKLTWNAYLNAATSPSYTIYVSENGAAFTTAGVTYGNFFNISSLKGGVNYSRR